MHILVFLNILFLLCIDLNIRPVEAKCCRADLGGDCGDNSLGTPCCGYDKCNAFCCACPGVTVIREFVELDKPSTSWTSVITAPPGTTWTCRASHITTWILPSSTSKSKSTSTSTSTSKADGCPCGNENAERDIQLSTIPLPSASVTATASATVPGEDVLSPESPVPTTFATVKEPRFVSAQNVAMDDDFTEMFSNLNRGFTFKGRKVVSKDQYLEFFGLSDLHSMTPEGEGVLRKFAWHDRDGDGYLDADEMMLRCDEYGCDD